MENRLGSRPILLLTALLAVLVHGTVFWSELLLDDTGLITTHPRLGSPGFVSEIWSRDYGLELSRRLPTGYYRPLLLLLDIGIHQLCGISPLAYHAVVLASFAGACVLLAWLVRIGAPTAPPWIALAVGALAAVHPMRTEFAVFFMSLPDVFVEICAILVLVIALRDADRWPSGLRETALVLLGFTAGISKETAFFVLGGIGGTLVLEGIWRRTPRRLGEGLSIIAGLAGAIGLRLWAGIIPQANSIFASLGSGSGRAFAVLAEGVQHLLLPSPTTFMSWAQPPPSVLAAIAVLAVFGALGAMLVRALHRGERFLALLLAWLVGGCTSLVLVGVQNLPYADRYFPSGAAILGLALLGANLAPRLRLSHMGRRVALLSLAGFVGIHAVYSALSTYECRQGVVFFTAMAEQQPSLSFPRIALARLYLREADFSRFDQSAREAIALAPESAKVRELGKLMAMRFLAERRVESALRALAWAEEIFVNDPEIWSLRGDCYRQTEDRAAEERCLRRALELAPGDPGLTEKLRKVLEP